ncbi:MAG: glycosyltransferase family 2 protein [Nitrospirota bacterium]
MRFSVLLPTRNRLELLAYAMETVRRQDYDDWEIVVSDNASEQDIAGYIRSLNEPRIKYVRTSSFVPVTDNWNNALKNSSGDYVIMLGDDDCLLKGFFRTMDRLIEAYEGPDCIYTNALLYAYPGVMREHPEGFLQAYGYAPFFDNASQPFLLDRTTAHALAYDAMQFKMSYTFNMQHSLVKRSFIDRLDIAGPFFQSPYPDFYATNVIMLKADTLVVNPTPMVVVGISPKSFGFYYFNDQEKKGVDFLNNLPDAETRQRMEHIILPGLTDKTAWLISMETIKMNYGSELPLQVAYNRYRYLQILHVYSQYARARKNRYPDLARYRAELDDLSSKLVYWEKAVYLTALRIAACTTRLVPRGLRGKLIDTIFVMIGKTPQLDLKKNERSYSNILEVFEQVDPQRYCP